MATHEDLSRTHRLQSSGNRAFGWVFMFGLLVIGVWPVIANQPVRRWALIASAIFLILTIFAPALLSLPNRLWQRFGLLLNRLTSPLALLVLFYAVVTPMAAIMRRFSNSGQRWRRNRTVSSYWIRRDPPGPDPDSLRNQF